MNDDQAIVARAPLLALRLSLLAVFAAASVAMLQPAAACTAALVQRGHERLVVKSFDWHDGSGFVVVNPAGQRKRALHLRPVAKPLQWTSRHASLTLNQHGPQMPISGMNDAGLVVETLWSKSCKYPGVDSRPAVNELQLVQWLLDRFATTKAAVKALSTVRVAAVTAKVHWLICDRGGDCAAVDYVDGALRLAHGATMPKLALANHVYGRAPATAEERRSLKRLNTAARFGAAQAHRGALSLRAATLLEAVRAGRYTKWQLIWDPKALTVALKTGAPKRLRARSVSLRSAKATCATGSVAIALDDATDGDVTTALAPINRERMTAQVAKAVRRLKLAHPKQLAAQVVAAGLSARCDATAQ